MERISEVQAADAAQFIWLVSDLVWRTASETYASPERIAMHKEGALTYPTLILYAYASGDSVERAAERIMDALDRRWCNEHGRAFGRKE